MITLDILTIDGVSQDLARVRHALDHEQGILEVAGAAGERRLQDHFQQRNETPNQRGFTRRNFWAGLAQVTGPTNVAGSEAIVTVNDPAFNLKVFGGDIRPKRGRALAIPETDLAYQAGSPSEGGIAGLWLFQYQDKDGKLRAALATGDKDDPTIHYWLVGGASQDADPDALPADDAFEAALAEAFDDWFGALGL